MIVDSSAIIQHILSFHIKRDELIKTVSCNAEKCTCSCDNVEGCVQASSTTDSLMYATSGKYNHK